MGKGRTVEVPTVGSKTVLPDSLDWYKKRLRWSQAKQPEPFRAPEQFWETLTPPKVGVQRSLNKPDFYVKVLSVMPAKADTQEVFSGFHPARERRARSTFMAHSRKGLLGTLAASAAKDQQPERGLSAQRCREKRLMEQGWILRWSETSSGERNE